MIYLYSYIILTIACSLVYIVAAAVLNKYRFAKWVFVFVPVTFMLSTAYLNYLYFTWTGEAFNAVFQGLMSIAGKT